MERSISVDERMKRAEEIYNRRHRVNEKTNTINITKSKKILTKKLFIKIIICMIIYSIFWMLKYSDENWNKKINEYLSTNTNFIELGKSFYDSIKNALSNFNSYIVNISNEEKIEQDNSTNTEVIENNDENNIETQTNTTEELNGIGGGETTEEIQPESQMEKDSKTIKENYSFIIPVQGVISSRFGPRESTQIISANHAGIDIAAETGKSIVSATDGIATEVSTEGDYGKHITITNGDLTILYAHCSELLITEGTNITQGTEIAKVGSTGKATGPHLHFEIKFQGRLVNPEYIMSF